MLLNAFALNPFGSGIFISNNINRNKMVQLTKLDILLCSNIYKHFINFTFVNNIKSKQCFLIQKYNTPVHTLNFDSVKNLKTGKTVETNF